MRLAAVTVNGFLACLWGLAGARVVLHAGWSGEAMAGWAYLGALVGLQAWCTIAVQKGVPRGAAWAILLAQAALVYAPLAHLEWWLGLPGVLAGNALLLLRPKLAVPLFVAVVVSFTWVRAEAGGDVLSAVYGGLTTVMTGLAVYGLTRLATLVRQVDAARDELARMRVVHERLRFARDLQEFLGKRLSGIAVAADRTAGALRASAEDVSGEVKEILLVARKALSDVRSVSSGYRQVSLHGELATARAILDAADIEVDLEIDDELDDLDAPRAALVAAALREGVANVLRHSSASRCEIAVRQVHGTLRLEIHNDGVESAFESGAQLRGGLGNLSERVTAAGGTVATARDDDGHYRLTVILNADAGEPSEGHALEPAMSRRLATTVVAGVFACYAGVVLTSLFVANPTWWQGVLASVFLAAVIGVLIGYVGRPGTRVSAGLRIAVVATQICVVYPATVFFGEWWLRSLSGFLVGSLLVLFPRRASIPMVVAAMAPVVWLEAMFSGDAVFVIGQVVDVVGTALIVYGMTRLARLVSELHAARAELARLAVAQERMRFARDVHDLLGLGLSAITLKAEVANKLLAQRPKRAAEQIVEVAALARKALGDMRSVVGGYQNLSLADELDSARSVLESAEIDVVITVDEAASVGEREPVLALVTREGVTNVLRHSKAARCEITLSVIDGQLQLDIRNDGVAADGVVLDDRGGGNGMQNMSHRVEEAGGRLEFGVEEDNYALCVRLPPPSKEPKGSATGSARS